MPDPPNGRYRNVGVGRVETSLPPRKKTVLGRAVEAWNSATKSSKTTKPVSIPKGKFSPRGAVLPAQLALAGLQMLPKDEEGQNFGTRIAPYAEPALNVAGMVAAPIPTALWSSLVDIPGLNVGEDEFLRDQETKGYVQRHYQPSEDAIVRSIAGRDLPYDSLRRRQILSSYFGGGSIGNVMIPDPFATNPGDMKMYPGRTNRQGGWNPGYGPQAEALAAIMRKQRGM